jgi:hypothetical protein
MPDVISRPGDAAAIADARHRVFLTSELVARLDVPPPSARSPVVCIVGPCRCGSTALLQATACAGYRSYFQPIKRLIRKLFLGENARWELRPSSTVVVVKETFGPFVPAEVAFDPVELLLHKGYRPEQLTLVTMLRSPRQLLISWAKYFRHPPLFPEIDLEIFADSFEQTARVLETARQTGVAAVAYVPDALESVGSDVVLARLFARIGLQYSRAAIDWRGAPPFGGPGSNAIREEIEPGFFRVPGVIDMVKEASGYAHAPAQRAESHLPGAADARLQPLEQIYQRIRRQSLLDFAASAG